MASKAHERKRGAEDPITRRSFLQKMGMGAAALSMGVLPEGAAAATNRRRADQREGRTMKVPMRVEYEFVWLSWVASATGCLKALGVDCGPAEVAGYSGYAFMLNVPTGLHPSGPTAFDWGLLHRGVSLLGRSTLVFHGAHCPCEMKSEAEAKRVRAEMRAAYEMVEREIAAGRPCVIWGTYDPDFGIAVGVEDDTYLVETFRRGTDEPQTPIPYDGLVCPSGAYALAFPTAIGVPRRQGDREALRHAVTMLNYKHGDPQYANGQAGYDRWIESLEGGEAEPHGNSYNAHCWEEARRFARDFLARVSTRNRDMSDALAPAIAAYGEVVEPLDKLTDLFPFPDRDRKVDDPQVRAKAIEHLRAAKAADTRAAAALTAAAGEWPPE
jgi:hypothetical protein